MAQFSFKTFSNKTAVLTITNATVTDGCHLGAQPIVTEIASDDDFFAPVRTQSGKISLVGSVEDMEGIIGDNPLDRPVQLTINGAVAWKGFLQSSGYSQAWNVGPNDIDIPIVSPLAVADGINIDASNLGYQTISEFVSEMNTKLGNVYAHIYYPTRNSSALNYKFFRKNYASYNKDDAKYDTESYLTVLTDICKLFGWQCQEKGADLIFTCLDVEHGETEEHSVCSADHTIDYIQGKKSVAVECAIKDFDGNIFSISKENYEESDIDSCQRSKEMLTYFYVTKTLIGSEITTHGGGNVKFLDYKNDTDDTLGADLIHERFINYNRYNRNEPGIQGDNDYNTRLVWRLESGTEICTIKPSEIFIPNPAVTQRISIDMMILASEDCMENYDVKKVTSGMPLKMYVKIGNQWFDGTSWSTTESNVNIGVTNGTFWYDTTLAIAYGTIFSIPCPDISGSIEIKLVANDDAKNYAIETFDVYLSNDWTKNDIFKGESYTIKKKYNIGNGFQEEYKVDTNLCCKKNSYDFGSSLIINSQNKYPTSLLSTGERPEEDFALRLKNYYIVTRKRVTANISGLMLDVRKLHSVGDIEEYAAMSQSIDWKREENKCTFFELP